VTACTLKVYVPADVPGSVSMVVVVPVPLPPQPPRPARAPSATITSNAPNICRQPRLRAGIPRNTSRARTAPPAVVQRLCFSALALAFCLTATTVVVLGSVVVTEKFSTCAALLGSVTINVGPPPVQLGASVAELAGDELATSEHVTVTVPAKPATADTVTAAVAVAPGATPPAGVTAIAGVVRLIVTPFPSTVSCAWPDPVSYVGSPL